MFFYENARGVGKIKFLKERAIDFSSPGFYNLYDMSSNPFFLNKRSKRFFSLFYYFLLFFFAFFPLRYLLASENLRWLTNYTQALAEAKRENKMVLMNFTGSDWCPWCQKLDKEVFSTPEFKNYAQKNLVLLEVDFPQHKSQPAELKKQNEDLANQYNVDSFPTLVLLSPQGEEVSSFGYIPGGPQPFIEKIEKLRQKAISKN
ncbi:thioredoxin family protein [Candidatus Methylacidiphilum infernorum]|uniref:Thiol-disulfide isomerase or thioredoxin n=1 Tax=Methylacidiphilum infernorum (isolate V4) TaxID=481448 RepID=B3DYD6_METI4|nr:thioredoxin family protein [Candidatus Methylacidiphilum infernorum]ACD82413.1 Thiol-disulfide isomerase or thioredoxin [Methylacidiphilum infernorum V4]